ncbi:MAG: diadenylate cyclase [Clostridia bacterium]|nr:diadenylate cyclase [Clostridia bacterium]
MPEFHLESLQLTDYLAVVLVAFMLIFVSVVAGKNQAGKYVALYLVLSIVSGVVVAIVWLYTENKYLGAVYVIGELIFSVFSLLLFPTEVRRLFLKNTKLKIVEPVRGEKKPEVEECISAVIKALQNMSKSDVGALVVLSNDNLPKQVLDSGVKLNADISSQLLEAIFFPKAPLHDGAVILSGHKIVAAGCFLPLTQNLSYPKELGTRHRAGIGITEVSNVTALIVSEETGIISIVKAGKVTRYADYDMLRGALEEYYWKDLSVEHKK